MSGNCNNCGNCGCDAETNVVGYDSQVWPYTTDAFLWADEFCARNAAVDREIMVGWFGSAIKAAHAAVKLKFEERGVNSSGSNVCCGDFEHCNEMCVPRASHWKLKATEYANALGDLNHAVKNMTASIELIGKLS